MQTRSPSKMEGGVDRLSNLPEDLLHQIFSKFDIEEVARTTCTLSKKWRYFWNSHPFLFFTSEFSMGSSEPEGNEPTQNFDDFVSHVLSFHKDTKITSFSVLSFGSCRKSHIQSWINFAVERDVEKLYLQSSKPNFDSLVLPTTLFVSKTLTLIQLGLNMSSKGSRVKLPLPESINLPSLQELSLQAMSKLNTEFLDTLFSGCPALDTLSVSHCVLDKSRKLLISSTQLKKLVICDCVTSDHRGISNIMVSAPNLASFNCTDCICNVYLLENLSSLESVDLDNISDYFQDCMIFDIISDYFQDSTQEENAERMIKFLQGIYNVKFLTLSASTVEEISKALDILKKPSLLFANLRHLKVTTRITKEYLQAIMHMLKTSPGVETLVMERIGEETNSLYIAERFPLQHVKFIQFETFVKDLKFLKILLKNAINLEKMTVVYDLESSDQLEVLKNELRACPRASPTAEVVVL